MIFNVYINLIKNLKEFILNIKEFKSYKETIYSSEKEL